MGVALITPFKEDDSIDYDALNRLVDYQLQNGTDFLCVLGTTAETPTLSPVEKEQIKKQIIQRAGGKLPILLGLGGNNTKEIVDHLKNDDFKSFIPVISSSEDPGHELLKNDFKKANVSLNFGIGLKLINHIQLGVNYNLLLTESAKMTSADPDYYSGGKLKNNTWQISLAYLF